MNNWQRYIGHEGIYLERGCVFKVRLQSVVHLEADGNVEVAREICTDRISGISA